MATPTHATPTPTAHIEPYDKGDVIVCTTWQHPDLDRTIGLGFVLRNKHTAARLARAINEGAVFTDVKILTDVNGRTYVGADTSVSARTASADLIRLGY